MPPSHARGSEYQTVWTGVWPFTVTFHRPMMMRKRLGFFSFIG